MKEAEYKLIVESEGKKYRCEGFTDYDEIKWNKIKEICRERKANIYDLIEDYLNKLTPEKAEEIVIGWDM